MKLKRKVIMLSTNDKAAPILSYLDDKGLIYFPQDEWNNKDLTKRHLYITSDEEIKEGDWFLSMFSNHILYNVKSDNNDDYPNVSGYKKIIATTNKSLGLPEPSIGFIKKFIERYNAGNPITEVTVDYEEDYIAACNIPASECLIKQSINGDCEGCKYCAVNLKVDKNNCITITAVKDSWTKEEVIAFAKKYADRAQAIIKPGDEWIEQNL